MKREDILIDKLNLAAHPEGGYHKETYRSSGIITEENLPESYSGDRNFCTSIYFLLKSDNFSAFHKINQDETWHFYEGSTITIHQISPDGVYSNTILGNDVINNQFPQYTVPGNYWFGATVDTKNSYSLAGCTVAPGFDFKDFVIPKRKELQELFPQHVAIITKLTHS